MRSRYAAFAMGLKDYLFATWHATTRPATIELKTEPPTRWIGLDIKKTASADDTATVEFVARYKIGGRAFRLHETSRFVREQGQWFYVEGDLH